ncbi:hypothetical protein D3C84_630920 [compost metagenome]
MPDEGVDHHQQRQQRAQVPVNETTHQFDHVCTAEIQHAWLAQQAAEGRQPGVLVKQRNTHGDRDDCAQDTQITMRQRQQQRRREYQVGQYLQVQVTRPQQYELEDEIQIPGAQARPDAH